MNGLILHCGSERVTRESLKAVPTPEPTPTWKPVPHHQVAELVANEATAKGYEIVSEDYGLNDAGTKMFGVLRFQPNGRPDMSRALGFRNSHDKSLALGLTAGVSVFCCDNLAFSGDLTIHRKHTSGIEIESLISQTFGKLEYQYVRLEETIEGLKLRMLSLDEFGAYLFLLITAWQEPSGIPLGEVRAALPPVSDETWSRIHVAVVERFFTTHNGRLVNKKLEEVREDHTQGLRNRASSHSQAQGRASRPEGADAQDMPQQDPLVFQGG